MEASRSCLRPKERLGYVLKGRVTMHNLVRDFSKLKFDNRANSKWRASRSQSLSKLRTFQMLKIGMFQGSRVSFPQRAARHW